MSDRTVSARELGEAFGLTDRRVRQLAQDGVIENVGKGNSTRFDWVDSTRKYIGYLKEQTAKLSTEEKDVEKRKAIADAEYKAAKAEQEKLELAEQEGNMHRTEDVQAMLEQLVYGTRSMLMALPGRTAIDVVGAANAAEAADIIRKQVNEVLNALSQYEFDPEFFADRVRDRKGWRTIVDDLSEPAGAKPKRGRSKGDKGVQGARKPSGE